jgi:hypothetical protein
MLKKVVFVLLLVFTFTNNGNTQEESSIALSVYNFTRYIEYPANEANNDFIIDVIGHRSVFDKLKETTAGRMVGKRPIMVRFLESADKITKSQILFVGHWQSASFPKVLEKVGNSRTLIISEKDGLIDAGAGINFVIRNNAIKFEIKRANIQKYGLILSGELEKIAYKAY